MPGGQGGASSAALDSLKPLMNMEFWGGGGWGLCVCDFLFSRY